MPVYEYYCSDCHTTFEALRAMGSADEPIACRQCGQPKRVNKVISTFARAGGSGIEMAGGTASGGSSSPSFSPGGCCGGGCGCS
ncbi:MAG: FmdB family zinc ribbon protein [Chloroflexota bacterium]